MPAIRQRRRDAHEAKLSVTSDERGFQALSLERAAAGGRDPEGAPQLDGRSFPSVRGLRRPDRRSRPRWRASWMSRPAPCRVRRQSARGRRCLTRSPATMPSPEAPTITAASPVSTGAGGEAAIELGDRVKEVEGRLDSPLGVLVRDGCSPDCHHRVADELLDSPAVQGDEPPAGVEVAGEELACVLRIPTLRRRGEPNQVCKQDRHQPSFRDRRLDSGGLGNCGDAHERRPAVAAESLTRPPHASARAADDGRRVPALAAEPLPIGIRRAARSAHTHRRSPERKDPLGQDTPV